MEKCSKCGSAISDNDPMAWKCTECGKAFRVNLSKLKKLQALKDKPENAGKMLLKCSACGNGIDNGNEKIEYKCSSCGNVMIGNLRDFMNNNIKTSIYTDVFISCPECGQKINNHADRCPECGYPLKSLQTNKVSHMKALRSLRTMLFMLSVIFFIISGIFFKKAYNVKNEYYNSENYTSLNKNAYVGGDAYNYIINGTYFTGYSIIASAMLISGIILISNSAKITIKEYE